MSSKVDLKTVIPEEFWSGEDQPAFSTVGELLELLKKLPEDLPVEDGVRVVAVYNVSTNAFFGIEEQF